MIQLQARPSMEDLLARDLSNLIVEPVTLVGGPGLRHIVLTQDAALGKVLDSAPGLIERLESEGVYQNGGWRVIKRGTVAYQAGRVVYDCLALKIAAKNAAAAK